MAAPITDEQIHKMAKARVEFKQHAAAYVIVNTMLVGIWFATSSGADGGLGWSSFWPIWPMLGWGVGLAFHGFGAYRPEGASVAREEQRIRDRMD